MIKKIIVLLITILVTTSCFNYVEINNLVIISGIGIDYKDNMYHVYAESLYQNKENSESNFEWGVIKEGTGKTISEAFDNLSLVIEKEPYYAHLKLVIISEEITNNHFNDLIDYFLRNNDIRNIFSLVVADKVQVKELLSNKDKYFPVASERIKELLESNTYTNYVSKNNYFKQIASNYISKNKDIALTMVSLEDKSPKISKLIIFNKKKPVGYLNEKEAETLSIISNKKPNILIKYKCENNNYITAKIYKSKLKIKIKKNSFELSPKLSAEIIENNCNINLEDRKEYDKVTNNYIITINNDIKNLINKLKTADSDLLGINKKYYNKYRIKDNNYFYNKSFTINTQIEVNKKGLIFEVNNND